MNDKQILHRSLELKQFTYNMVGVKMPQKHQCSMAFLIHKESKKCNFTSTVQTIFILSHSV